MAAIMKELKRGSGSRVGARVEGIRQNNALTSVNKSRKARCTTTFFPTTATISTFAPVGVMSSPQILFTLPLPFDHRAGRTQVSEVKSIAGSRKRKRLEVAAAVDGEGISIHSIRNPRLLASYAIPPHSKFLTPPRSIFQKRNAQQLPHRFTYAAIQHDDVQARFEVIAFTEEVRQRGPIVANQVQTFRCPVDDPSIYSVEVIPGTRLTQSQRSSHDVLVIYRNGRVQCLSADLQTIRWTATTTPLRAPTGADGTVRTMQVEMATLTDAATASRGVLRDRQDVISALGHLEERPEILAAIPLLFVVTSTSRPNSNTSRALHVFSLNPSTSGLSMGLDKAQTVALPRLNVWPLPRLAHNDSDQKPINPRYRFCASSARLYEFHDTLTVYDLSGLVVRTISSFHMASQSRDLLPISSSFVMLSTDESCMIYDVKFNSLQKTFNCGVDAYSESETQNQNSVTVKGFERDPTFVCYFSDSSLAVALQGNTVIGFQLSSITSSLKRKRGSSRLIDSIQKGVGLGEAHLSHPDTQHSRFPLKKAIHGLRSEANEAWMTETTDLDACVKADDVHHFEEIFLESDTSSSSVKNLEGWDPKLDEEHALPLLNGNHKVPSAVDTTVDTTNRSQIPIRSARAHGDEMSDFVPLEKRKAIYALGKIFAVNSEEKLEQHRSSRLQIRFYPPNVFRRIAHSGYVNSETIMQALSEQDPHYRISRQFDAADVVKAIFNLDPSGRLLHAYLDELAHLDILEILHAVQLLLAVTNRQRHSAIEDAPGNRKILQNGDRNVMVNGHSSDNNAIHEAGVTCKEALASAVTRLHIFPSERIIQEMQTVLTSQELRSMVQILRKQLSGGGWLSHYVDLQLQNSIHSSTTKTPLTVITQILNCAIDAVGISGWLVGQETQDLNRQLLSTLRTEASMALESIHEMQSLGDILTEFSKHGPTTTVSAQLEGRNVFSHNLASSPALSLGTAQDADVSKLKIVAGGRVVKRTKREIGHERSKRVPEYSLDSIRF
ncbi:MAG: hypothetical protein M1822_007122 [Bathelium mastoideum]|nr:MAG: hypothetical protein M1822_007122 [Bathelium mastoideum]